MPKQKSIAERRVEALVELATVAAVVDELWREDLVYGNSDGQRALRKLSLVVSKMYALTEEENSHKKV